MPLEVHENHRMRNLTIREQMDRARHSGEDVALHRYNENGWMQERVLDLQLEVHENHRMGNLTIREQMD